MKVVDIPNISLIFPSAHMNPTHFWWNSRFLNECDVAMKHSIDQVLFLVCSRIIALLFSFLFSTALRCVGRSIKTFFFVQEFPMCACVSQTWKILCVYICFFSKWSRPRALGDKHGATFSLLSLIYWRLACVFLWYCRICFFQFRWGLEIINFCEL